MPAALVLAVTAATVAVALAAADPAGAAPPPTLPAGYVQLVDDTGTITVAVPDTWTDVDTVPAVNPDGTPQPWIEAAPDRQAFEDTWNVPGVLFYAAPFTADPQSLMDDAGTFQWLHVRGPALRRRRLRRARPGRRAVRSR